ncbi:MAG: hypothetical protein JWN62_410 [Acidimicrobiales bacterium]|nr:hypothetical protein [Acidimicrobiales bacterium]
MPGIDASGKPSGEQPSTGAGRATPSWLRKSVESIEGSTALDPAVDLLTPVAASVGAGARGDALRGRRLGHALHPLLTDLPLGCWIGAGLLDLFGGKGARRAAQRLVGLGLVFVPPTAAAGMADLSAVDEQRIRRVGAAHATGNTMVALLYWCSWRARRRHQHVRGVVYGLLGGLLAWGTGYLGGHLSFGRGVGVGPRGLDDDAPSGAGGRQRVDTGAVPDVAELIDIAAAAELLMVEPDQIHAMVAGGLLVPADGDHSAVTFTRAAVLAARSLGG